MRFVCLYDMPYRKNVPIPNTLQFIRERYGKMTVLCATICVSASLFGGPLRHLFTEQPLVAITVAEFLVVCELLPAFKAMLPTARVQRGKDHVTQNM